MDDFTVTEMDKAKVVKIKIVGVGGGGGNMVNHMVKEGLNSLDNIDLIAANTDAQALYRSLATTKIQLGEKATKGLGAGGKPEVGTTSANESFEELKAALDKSDMVFIASGLGGGTGTGASPIVARAAKEVGALTVAVVTMPFGFEGGVKKGFAEKGLSELRKECDSVLVVYNEKVKMLIDKNTPANGMYGLINDVSVRAVKGAVYVVAGNGEMNIDFADIRSMMENSGSALMGVGSGQGENAAQEAVDNALDSPLLEGLNIKDSRGIIMHLKHHPEFPAMQIMEAIGSVSMLRDGLNFKYGWTPDENMDTDRIEVTIIATGFEEETKQPSTSAILEATGTDNPFAKFGIDFAKLPEDRKMKRDSAYLEQSTYKRNQMD